MTSRVNTNFVCFDFSEQHRVLHGRGGEDDRDVPGTGRLQDLLHQIQ